MSMFDDFEHSPEHYEDKTIVKRVYPKWQKTAPTEAGEWLMKCCESEYSLELVKVESIRGELWAVDCAIGSLPVAMYHDGLTDCSWCKV